MKKWMIILGCALLVGASGYLLLDQYARHASPINQSPVSPTSTSPPQPRAEGDHPPAIDYALHGRVLDQDTRRPISGMLIHATPRADLPPVTAVTTEDGLYAFNTLPPGQYTVSHEGDSNYPNPQPNEHKRIEITGESPPIRADFTLTRGLTIAGNVVDEEGQPVAGATVRARQLIIASGKPHEEYAETTASGEGTFTLGAFQHNANLFLVANHHESTSGWVGPLNPQADPQTRQVAGVILTLRQGGQINGTAITASSYPLPHAQVQLRNANPNAAGQTQTVTADETGRFSFAPLPPGEYRLHAVPREFTSVSGQVPATVTLEPGQTLHNIQVIFDDHAQRTLGGTVRDPNGAPIPGVEFLVEGLLSYSVFTGSDGIYRAPFLAEITHTVTTQHPAYESLSLEAVPDNLALDFTIRPFHHIPIAVIEDSTEEPLPNFQLTVEPATMAFPNYTLQVSNPAGRHHLQPADFFPVRIFAQTFSPQEPAIAIAVSAPGFEKERRELTVHDILDAPPEEILFRLLPAGDHIITGRVIQEDETPIPAAEIYVMQHGGYNPNNPFPTVTRTGPDGSFKLSNPEGKIYSIWARHPQFAPNNAHPTHDNQPLTIILTQGGTIEGTVRVDGEPAPDVSVGIRSGQRYWPSKTDGAGKYQFSKVPPGRIQVTVLHYKETIWVRSDTTHIVDFDILPSETNTSRVEGIVTINGLTPPGHSVILVMTPTGANTQFERTAVTQPGSGRYYIPDVPPGSGFLHASVRTNVDQPYHKRIPIEIPPNQILTVDIELTGQASLDANITTPFNLATAFLFPAGVDVDLSDHESATYFEINNYAALSLHPLTYISLNRNDPHFNIPNLDLQEYNLVLIYVPMGVTTADEYQITQIPINLTQPNTQLDLTLSP